MNILIDGVARGTIMQPTTGNILDFSPRSVERVRVTESEETAPVASLTQKPMRRQYSIRIDSPDSDLLQLAHIMQQVDCPVMGFVLGKDTHVAFAETGAIRIVTPEYGQTGSVVSKSIRIDAERFHSDVSAGRSLLDSVPWTGATTETASTIAQLSTRTADQSDFVDLTSVGATSYAVADDGYRYSTFGGTNPTIPDVGSARGITFDGADLIYANEENGLFYFNVTDTSNNFVSEDEIGSEFRTALAYHQGEDLLYAINTGSLGGATPTIDVFDGTALDGSTISPLRNFGGNNAAPTGIVVDQEEDELLIATDAGEVEVWDVFGSGTAEEYVSTYDGSVFGLDTYYDEVSAWDGLMIHEEALYGLTTGSADLDVLSRWQLGRANQPTWRGRAWRTRRSVSPGIDGQVSTVNSTYPARLRMIAPLINAEVTLQQVTGNLDALSWSGTALNLSGGTIADPPSLLLQGGKYSGLDIDASSIWILDALAQDVSGVPQLVVDQVGGPLGVRRGGVVTDCQTRVSDPAWKDVNAIAFDVQVNDGDQLGVTVTEAPGVDVIEGMISGDGQSDKSTQGAGATESFGFTYSVDSPPQTYTAELVAEALGGITELKINFGDGKFELVDYTSLTDLEVLRGNEPFLSDSSNFATPPLRRLRMGGGGGKNIPIDNVDPVSEVFYFFRFTLTGDINGLFSTCSFSDLVLARCTMPDVSAVDTLPVETVNLAFSEYTGEKFDVRALSSSHSLKEFAAGLTRDTVVELGDGSDTDASKDYQTILSAPDVELIRVKDVTGELSIPTRLLVSQIGRAEGRVGGSAGNTPNDPSLAPNASHWQNATSSPELTQWSYRHNGGTIDGISPATLPAVIPDGSSGNGRGLNDTVEYLWDQRNNFSGSPTVEIEERDGGSPPVLGTSMEQDAINKIAGFGIDSGLAYDAEEDGIIDSSITGLFYNHGSVELVTIDIDADASANGGDGTLTIDLDEVPGGPSDDSRWFPKTNYPSSFDSYTDLIDASFPAGNEIRIGGTSNLNGVYRVGSTVQDPNGNGNDNILQINVNDVDGNHSVSSTETVTGATLIIQIGDNPKR